MFLMLIGCQSGHAEARDWLKLKPRGASSVKAKITVYDLEISVFCVVHLSQQFF